MNIYAILLSPVLDYGQISFCSAWTEERDGKHKEATASGDRHSYVLANTHNIVAATQSARDFLSSSVSGAATGNGLKTRGCRPVVLREKEMKIICVLLAAFGFMLSTAKAADRAHWQGLYLGLFAGVSNFGYEANDAPAGRPISLATDEPHSKLIFGASVGYDHLIDDLVLLGFQFEYGNIHEGLDDIRSTTRVSPDYSTYPPDYTGPYFITDLTGIQEIDHKETYSARLRMGMLLTDRVLIFGTIGNSWIKTDVRTRLSQYDAAFLSSLDDPPDSENYFIYDRRKFTKISSRLELGVGAEVALTNHLFLGVEGQFFLAPEKFDHNRLYYMGPVRIDNHAFKATMKVKFN